MHSFLLHSVKSRINTTTLSIVGSKQRSIRKLSVVELRIKKEGDKKKKPLDENAL
jgi:hypothetical protein